MTTPDEPPLEQRLAELPTAPLTAERADAILRLARAAFVEEHARAARSESPLERLWNRLALPTLVGTGLALQLGMALSAAASVYR